MTEESSISTELTTTDPVTAALAAVTSTNQTLTQLVLHARDLHERFKDVVFDVATTKGMDEAKKARLALREESRYPMQNLQKQGSKLLGSMQRQFNERANELIAEVVDQYEAPIHQQIEAEETRKEQARAEREAADAARKQGLQDAVTSIGLHALQAAGLTAAEIGARIEAVKGIEIDESWEEYRGQAQQAKDEAVRQLEGLRVAAQMDEAERAELEETRRQQAIVAAQQAHRLADLERREREATEREAAQTAEREQIERAKRERAEAVGYRLAVLSQMGVQFNAASPSVHIRQELDSVPALATITAELYDDRVHEALHWHEAAVSGLTRLYESAVEREAAEAERQRVIAEEDARRALAERIQVNLNNLSIYTKAPPTAAGSQWVRSAIAALTQDPLLFEDYGSRLAEAEAMKATGLANLESVLQQELEREEEAARQAAELERQQAVEAKERAMAQRMLDRAARMYHLLVDWDALFIPGEPIDPKAIRELKALTAELVAFIQGVQP